jgi:hypothetical protein
MTRVGSQGHSKKKKYLIFALSTSFLDISMRITTFKINSDTSVNFIQEYVGTTWLEILTYLSSWLPVIIFKICSGLSVFKLGMLLLYAIELYLHTDGDLSLLHVEDFMCMDGL